MCRQPEGSCRQVLLSRTMFMGFGLCLSTGKGHLSTGVNRSKERETCRGSHNSFNWSSSTPPGTQQQAQHLQELSSSSYGQAATLATARTTIVATGSRVVETAAPVATAETTRREQEQDWASGGESSHEGLKERFYIPQLLMHALNVGCTSVGGIFMKTPKLHIQGEPHIQGEQTLRGSSNQ
ncbi:hypothetical protein Taro_030349 [Colocasia esculenta]|uniref:Uncharacterized protein n=1 Tax=Colocasia esculenta TaxID=4460 RepID=A0A843VG47_COLES|nr:hypothetical protein [Colocasia esculenta]